MLAINLKIDAATVILNNYKGKSKMLVNTLILILKQYIYATKCKKEQANFIGYMTYVHYLYKIERLAALRHDKWKTHQRKWKDFI